jgi:hypothetical protein
MNRLASAQAMSVLVEAAVADHDEAERPLDDVEGMLDLGPLGLVEHATMTVAAVGEGQGFGRVRFDHFGLTTR